MIGYRERLRKFSDGRRKPIPNYTEKQLKADIRQLLNDTEYKAEVSEEDYYAQYNRVETRRISDPVPWYIRNK